MITIPVSYGEFLDKLSILEIKKEKIVDVSKKDYINSEYDILLDKVRGILNNETVLELYKKLIDINNKLWDVEDILRILEKEQRFQGEFIHYARQVYKLNDERYSIKNEINLHLNSEIREIKQYVDYR